MLSPVADTHKRRQGERLELVQADLLEESSFDSAVIGCSGVFHTASPFFRRALVSGNLCFNCECRPEDPYTIALSPHNLLPRNCRIFD